MKGESVVTVVDLRGLEVGKLPELWVKPGLPKRASQAHEAGDGFGKMGQHLERV
jgi:hypothetical protein